MNKHYMLFTIVAGMVVILDQVSKAIVVQVMPLHSTIEVIPGFFNLTHIHNPGGAFGFLAGNDVALRHAIFLGVSVAALLLILYFYHNTPMSHSFLGIGLAMVFGGAAGNLIDRFRLGEVVDFLDFYVGSTHWPAFNAADSAITVGIGIFIAHVVFNRMPA
jgi:signal peptidase II